MLEIDSSKQSVNHRLDHWCQTLADQAAGTRNLTIGLTSGNRYANDARVLFRVAKSLTANIDQSRRNTGNSDGLLICRLDVNSAPLNWLGSADDNAVEPIIEKSALGDWHQVEIPIVIGRVAPKSLQQVPRWLPKWKLRFRTILIDLGPMHLVPSRTIGRLCDVNYVILGPHTCASAQWINQHIDYHSECGSHIAGSVVALASA